MPYPIERKLVVGVSASALFDLSHEDKVFRDSGIEAYRKLQAARRHTPLGKGAAFPFIRRFLAINKTYSLESPVEVVLLSRNSPETGLRIFDAIRTHELPISRAAFTSGRSPYEYIPSFNISLFLSTNATDVENAISAGHPAGRFVGPIVQDNDEDVELRVAFDFDGVIADDQAESVYQDTQDLQQYFAFEEKHATEPHGPGPLADFFKKLAFFQKLESKKAEDNHSYNKILRTAIITARNAPAHERAITTLNHWGVSVDEMFLLGGIEKHHILNVFKPQIYFDDQIGHLNPELVAIPMVHIPFGITNKPTKPDVGPAG